MGPPGMNGGWQPGTGHGAGGWPSRSKPQSKLLPPLCQLQLTPTPKRELIHADACSCETTAKHRVSKPIGSILFIVWLSSVEG
jgi:hypothetical protein